MNYRLFALLLILICSYITVMKADELDILAAQHLRENEKVVTTIDRKIYVEPSQIRFSNNQIFVQTPKGMFQIPKLYSDDIGIYYKSVHPYSWYCHHRFSEGRVCGHYNTYIYYCEECGHAPGD